MFDPAPIWVTGTVVSYAPVNPHATIVLEQSRADGQVRQWTVEGPRLVRIGMMGAQPKVGDVIEVCGFALKKGLSIRSPSADPYGLSEQFVHGLVLAMPDGHFELFGPYGKLDHCIRSGDDTQVWLDFLNSYGQALVAWCNGLSFSIESIAPQAIVDEINAAMGDPCD